MTIQKEIHDLLVLLANAINRLDDATYRQPLPLFPWLSTGQQVKQIIDMYKCLQQGYETGCVDYKRKPANPKIETDREFAKKQLYLAYTSIVNPEKTVAVQVSYFSDRVSLGVFISSYRQELTYLLEFTQHHMGLIKTGLEGTASAILPQGFGETTDTTAYERLRQQ